MRYGLPFAAMAGIAAAHSLGGIPGAPNFVGGRRFLAEMKGKRAPLAAAPSVPRAQPQHEEKRAAKVDARQNTDDQCGPGFGSCAAGYCCSSAGWCGQGTDYCAAPDCQQNYGPGCDANQKPSGADTSGADRTHFGSVTYSGAGIYDCVNAGDIAITFDDGPYLYTSDLLDKLAAYNAKATFFITGNNLGKGMINNAATGYPSLIKRMHADGHQIASHTWSHQNSSQTSAEQWRQQMIWNEIALNDILGFFPTYMRPPYSICESQCQSILSQLGYHITYFDLDTEGYLHNSADAIGQSKAILDNALASSSPSSDAWLHIEHDIQYYTVYSLMDYMLSQLQAKGWNMVTVGECLGDPEMYWYRTISGTVPSGTSTTTATQPTGTNRVSTDGTCGNGITCQGSEFGNCCSQHGWCGSTTDYCSTGCQPAFGTCSSSGSSSSSTTKTTTSTKPTSTNRVSTDGTCGNGVTCLNSGFGNCCSQYGWCGSTTGHCDAATCQPQFGTCSGSGTSSGSGTTTRTSTTTKTNTTTKTSSPPTSTATVSTEGTCGNGITCQGSSFGNCCSQHGWCGSTSAYCGAGCQSSWGTCS